MIHGRENRLMNENVKNIKEIRFVSRRQFIGGVAASLPLAYAPSSGRAQEISSLDSKAVPESSFPGIIVRQKEPLNAEYPFPTLDSHLTPNERFYIRTHFEVPEIDAKDWRLKVEGEVENPFEIDLEDL
jgi:DMSO/TMAO reductase YedYZ molybdopterin-dependent catalytic subunit